MATGEVASIGVGMETSEVEKGIKVLKSLADEGPRVERAMGGVEQATGKATRTLKSLGDGADKGLHNVAQAAPKAEAGMGRVATSASALQKRLADIKSEAAGAGTAFTNLGSALAYVGVGIGALSLGGMVGKLVEVQREFDVLNASLVTVTGSTAAAAREFEWLKEFAKETPFGLTQATEAFIKMKSLGLEPSRASLTSFGNTASAMGKSLNQMIEAVADASTSEFERLKEFGIKASQSGETVAMTFQGVTKNIGNNAKEIVAYLDDIGNHQFAGAMEERAKTLDGAIAELGDTWDEVFRTINENNTGNLIHDSVRLATGAVQDLNSILQALNSTSEQGARSSGAFKTVQEGLAIVFEAVAVSGLTVKDTLVGVGREIGAIAAQAAALARLDFKGFSAIGDMAKEDAEKARAEWDRAVNAILTARQRVAEAPAITNPKDATANKQTVVDLTSIATAALNATSGYKSQAEQMAEVRAQGDKLRNALKQLEEGGKGASKEAEQLRDRLKGVDEKLKSMAKSGQSGASGLKQQENAYKSLSQRIEDYVTQLKLEAAQGSKVTTAQKLQIQLDDMLAKGVGKVTAAEIARAKAGIASALAMEKEAKAIKQAAAAYEEYLKEQEEIADAAVQASKAKEELWKSISAANLALEQEAQLLEVEERTIGMTTAARNTAIEAMRIQIELQNELNAISNNTGLDGAAKLEAETAARERAVKKLALAERKTYVAEWEKTSQLIGDTLADYIMGGGKDAATYLKRLFSTLVLQPVVKTAVSGLLGGGQGGGGQGEGGGGFGGTDILSGVKKLFPEYSDQIDTGATIISYGKAIYDITQGEYGKGIGTAIGTYVAGPVGAIVGSTIGGWLDDKFGSTPHAGAASQYAGGSVVSGGKQFTRSAINADYMGEMQGAIDSLALTLGSTLDGVSKLFGGAGGYSVTTGFKSDDDDPSNGMLWITNADGESLVKWLAQRSGEYGSRATGQSYASDPQEGLDDYLTAVTAATIPQFKAIVPEWADAMLDSFSQSIGFSGNGNDWKSITASGADSMQGLQNVLQQIAQVEAAFKSLGETIPMFAGLTDDMINTFMQSAGGSVDTLSSVISGYDNAFTSEAEKLERAFDQLEAAVGIDPRLGEEAAKQYQAAVEEAMAAGNASLAYALMSVAPAFKAATDAAIESAAKLNEAQLAREQQERDYLAEALAEQHLLWADLAEASGDAATAAQRRYWIETEGMTLAEQAAYDYNRAIMAQISSAQAASAALSSLGAIQFDLENQLLSLQGRGGEVEERTRTKELGELLEGVDDEEKRKQITASYDYNASLRKQIEAMQAAAQAASSSASAQQSAADSIRTAWQSIGDSIIDEINRIRGVVVTDSGLGLDYYQAQFAITTAQARAGDQKAADMLPEVSRSLLTMAEASATSLAELQRYRNLTASSLEETVRQLSQSFGITVDLPRLDVGTNYVQRSGLAVIHEGEAVVPKPFNPWANGQSMGNDNAELVAEVRALREENRVQAGEIVRLNLRMTKVLEKWDFDGMPEEREVMA